MPDIHEVTSFFRQSPTMRSSILWAALCVMLLTAPAARAQSLFGGSSGNSSSGRGGTISAGQRSLGGTNKGIDQQAQVGQISGSERYVRDSRQPGQFVGADKSDTTNISSALQQGGLQSQLQALNRLQSTANQGNRNTTANKKQPRVSLSLAMEPAPVAPEAVAVNVVVAQRLANLPGLKLTSPLEVLLAERTATLRGSVATPRDRELAAQLVLLEPGVSKVVNELVVNLPAEPAPGPAAK